MDSNPGKTSTENIDEVILRLLKLEPYEIEDIDYETYRSGIAEILVENELSVKKISEKEIILLKDEFDRVKKLKYLLLHHLQDLVVDLLQKQDQL